MPLLAIDTATRQMGVAVIEDGRLLASYELLADYPHAVELPGAVRRVLQAAGLPLSRIDGIIIDIGPGSFTGLRIGLAFAKALAFPGKKPLIGVPSLDVLAAGAAYAPLAVCPVLDARQKNVYAARYTPRGAAVERQGELFLGPITDWLPSVKEPALFLGDGCGPYREQIVRHLGDKARFAPHDLWWPRVSVLARLGADRFQAGHRDNPAALIPLYLYPLDCSVRGPDRPTAILTKTNA